MIVHSSSDEILAVLCIKEIYKRDFLKAFYLIYEIFSQVNIILNILSIIVTVVEYIYIYIFLMSIICIVWLVFNYDLYLYTVVVSMGEDNSFNHEVYIL